VPAQHQRLDRQQEGLNAYDACVRDGKCIDGMQPEPLEGAGLFRRDLVVIAGVGVLI
jgi:hypothetical protein